ncbi:sulfatase [Streptomyces sp. MA5143a]|uniref:sulfatase n=1 Tax=Streptomyces sp. MA5143a TaxID=2083010 RepID=UPI000D19F71C|nr:sulfatase [Streptomyces sp. MA5143a]SPE99668.1 Phosphoglycerol transferase, alkaline phosphatase superfamily [Streptomyces sp. MA5143a]
MSHTRSSQLPGPAPAPDVDTAPENTAEAAEPKPKPEEAAAPAPDTDSVPGAEAEAGSTTEPVAEPEPKSEPKGEAEPEAGADAKAEAGGEPEGETATEPMAEPKPGPDVKPKADTEPGPDAKPEPDAEPGPDAKPEAESQTEAEPKVAVAAGGEGASVRQGWRVRHPRRARVLDWVGTALAIAFVMFALLVPNDMTKFEVGRLLRIPAEGILGAALLLVLPPKARRTAVVVIGAVLGLLMIVKVLDMGSYWTLDRPFDLVLDWPLLDNARSFMKDSLGNTAAQAATIGVIALVLALPFLTTFAVRRISRLMERDRHTASRTLLVLGTVWITCSTLTLEVADVPLASHSAATLVENRIESVRDGLKDGEAFEKQASVDAFADVPPDQLLTGLRGKDVLITFIESYGRSAIDNPQMGEPLSETLAQKTQELKDAGYASRSGWLRSPITGAGSWLGHSTFLSGLWIKNQSRYNHLVAGDRLTLTEAFRRTGAWRTVGIVPGTQKAWPEGKFFGLDHIYDSDQLGYQGPKFSWSTMPDQYTLKAFRELEYGKEGRKPMMAEIILTSSHNPWAPIPRTIPEEEIGDGSVYHGLQKAEGKDPKDVWKNPLDVRDEYRKTIQYSVSSIVDFVAEYGSKDTVLIFLGDHQPNKTVTGDNPSHDVPVSVVAQDPKVLEKIDDWGWADGLKPASDTPVWRMDKFRDQFMTAFGPQSGDTPQ